MRVFRAHLIDLNVVAVDLRRKTPGLKFLRLAVEFHYAALKLHPHPKVFILVESQSQDASGQVRLQTGDRVLSDFASPGIHLTQNLFAEAGIPCHPFGIHDYVVWLTCTLPQIVFGVDDLSSSSRGPRMRLKGKLPMVRSAEIDAAQI